MTTRARLPFADPSHPKRCGELQITQDNSLVLFASPELKEELARFASEFDTLALKWGTSLVTGIAAVGAFCYVREQKPLAYLCFGLSAVTGFVGRSVRGSVRNWESLLFSPIPAKQVRLTLTDDSLRLDFFPPHATPLPGILQLDSREFDFGDAVAFVQEWEKATQEVGR